MTPTFGALETGARWPAASCHPRRDDPDRLSSVDRFFLRKWALWQRVAPTQIVFPTHPARESH
jgi:hypothetical protein